MSLAEPSFIERDPEAVTAAMVAAWEETTGKALYPAQVEALLIDMVAYRESLVRIGIQEAAKQNLVTYARAPMLDHLGQLVGCTRLNGETDDRFRVRILLAPEAAACGTLAAYRYAALSVSLEVSEAIVTSSAPGVVSIAVVTMAADEEALLAKVRAALNAEDVRPLTDQVIVVGVEA